MAKKKNYLFQRQMDKSGQCTNDGGDECTSNALPARNYLVQLKNKFSMDLSFEFIAVSHTKVRHMREKKVNAIKKKR